VAKLSFERVLKALMGLGLSQRDAKIYLYLATRGPQEACNIEDNLKLSKQQLNSSLKSLQGRKIVISTFACSNQFKALPFKKTMALLVKAKRMEIQHLEQKKDKVLSEWRSIR
jgi:sugar-specific transcriptional regulator TrmB